MNKNDMVMWLFMLLVLIYAGVVKAGPVRVSYTLPETREDGEPIKPGELDKVHILIAVDASDDGSYRITLEPGVYEFKARAVDSDGVESEWSDVAAVSDDRPACSAYNLEFTADLQADVDMFDKKLLCYLYGHVSIYQGYCADIN